MKLFDITRPFFATDVYPGDPVPSAVSFLSIEKGDSCNLHTLFFGTHTSTHMDAPCHFFNDGKSIDEIDMEKCIGPCLVAETDGILNREALENILVSAHPAVTFQDLHSSPVPEANSSLCRLLIKGNAVLTPDGAAFLVDQGILTFGTELCTVGNEKTEEEVHRTLLGAETVILENLELSHVIPGFYFLLAQPLKLEGMDGSPVRAVLLSCGQ